MTGAGEGRPRVPEARLDALREEAGRSGRVEGTGTAVTGGPLPGSSAPGYYGLPVLKPPVWTWEIPVYFFLGGLAGGAAVLALAVFLLEGHGGPLRVAAWAAAGGALGSTVLLVSDLGRPRRFLNMLRVFKLRSAMSVGAWSLAGFGTAAGAAALLVTFGSRLVGVGLPGAGVRFLTGSSVAAAGVLGAVLATYTGVLLGATAVPAWSAHRSLLPVHFGIAGLGSAAAFLELLGFRLEPLHVLGIAVALGETLVGAAVELRRHGPADRALRRGRAGFLLRTAGVLAGPGALVLRLAGHVPAAAVAFLAGALLSRFGWVEAGRASARDPEAAFAAAGRSS